MKADLTRVRGDFHSEPRLVRLSTAGPPLANRGAIQSTATGVRFLRLPRLALQWLRTTPIVEGRTSIREHEM